MKELRILSATAILGYGFPMESFRRGLAARPHLIAADAGSTDPGPAYLGSGKSFVDAGAVRRDLEIMLRAGLERGIPVVIGTAGGSGSRAHVDGFLKIAQSICREHKLRPRTAVVYSDVAAATVRKALKDDRIEPLPFVPPLDAEALRQTKRIVAQIGLEPLLEALSQPVDLVVAGRCYDPAVFAALPVLRGFDRGLALHLGKILECAAIAATPGSGRDCVLGVLRHDSFVLRPLSDARRFTVRSVAAHTLYEKSHPYVLPGPGGSLDLSGAKFRQLAAGAVEVRGSRFVPADYTVKIEGARRVGFRTVAICGIRDRIMISKLSEIFDGVRHAVGENFGERPYTLNFRVYGRDGVMGPLEPQRRVSGHEVGLVIDVVAPTQAEADTVCGFARSTMLHYGYPGRIATAGNLAFPFSPSDLSAGAVYEFSIYHLMKIADPAKLFPVRRMKLGGRS